nr:MAG TPA: hypothetical protein [Caudoviricetes sp.]
MFKEFKFTLRKLGGGVQIPIITRKEDAIA